MFSRRRRSDESDGVSPWSTEANAPDAPPLTWETPAPPIDDAGGDSSTDADPPEVGPSRTGWIAAAVVAAVTLAGLVWLWPSNVDEGDDPDAAADDPPVTTLGTLPPPTTVVDAQTPDERDDALREEAEAEARADAAAEGSGSVQRPSVPDAQTIELPDGLPEFERPFELVMTTSGGLATLSFPSGTLRTTPLEAPGDESWVDGLIVAPDTAFVSIGGGSIIVDRRGRTIEALTSLASGGSTPIGWGTVDGETTFSVIQWDEFGIPQTSMVGLDGALLTTQPVHSWPVFAAADGSQIVNDAGGVYRLAFDGTTSRVSTGALVGFGQDRVAVRTCDETRSCRLSTLHLASGEVIDFTGDEAVDVLPFGVLGNGANVSPDGTMLVIGRPNDLGEVDQLVIHADGSTTEGVRNSGAWPWSSQLAWAPDSSGYFAREDSTAPAASSLRFVTRTGDVLAFDDVPSDIGWTGIRPIEEELPAIETGSLGIDPIADIGVGIVGLDRGSAVHIDLGAGSMATWATPDVGGVPDLFHVDTAVIGVSSTGDVSFRSFAGTVMDGRKDPVDPPGSPRYQGSDDRLVWRPDAAGEVYELVPMPFHDVAGRSAWQTIEVGRDAVYGTNGAGGLVYEQGGDIFVSDASGPQRLTSGELVAIGPTTALVHECDDAGACGNVLIDAEGGRTPVSGPPGAAVSIEPRNAVDGSFSRNGQVTLVQLPLVVDGENTPEQDRQWALVDWITERTLAVPPPDRGAELHWTTDSRYAFYLSGDRIHMFDRDAGSIDVLDGAGDFDAITLVPLEFAPDTAAD